MGVGPTQRCFVLIASWFCELWGVGRAPEAPSLPTLPKRTPIRILTAAPREATQNRQRRALTERVAFLRVPKRARPIERGRIWQSRVPMTMLRQGAPINRLRSHADGRADTVRQVDVDRIWSAAELEALTPDDRAANIRAGFVSDPANVPADLVDRARRKADARIAATEGRQARQ